MKETERDRNYPASDQVYQNQILQGVSRSFALTIPQLPKGLRSVVTNAYLLCRVADTIEDEKNLSMEQKRFFFREFIAVVNGEVSPDDFANALYPLLSNGTSLAERQLVANTSRIIQITLDFSEKQREELKRCVTIMCNGMQRFQEIKNTHGLEDLNHLNLYCYHVAGVVGELLTALFCQYSTAIAKHRKALSELAISFGQGLQMTNILKDLWDDRDKGACWLPRDIFQRAGFDLKGLTRGRYATPFGEGLCNLIAIAHTHLQNGLAYTCLLPRQERGIRRFCLWAIGMAIFTLRKINRRRDFTSSQEVKISHSTLKGIIMTSNLVLRSNSLLKMLFGLSARGLPISRE